MNDNINDENLKDIEKQTRADWKNMIYADSKRDGNNAKFFHEDMTWYKTDNDTKDLPKSHGFNNETNVGMLITCRSGFKTDRFHNQSNVSGTQYFFPSVKDMHTAHTGKIYVRYGFNVGKATWVGSSNSWQNEQTQWGTWYEIKGAKGDKGEKGEQGPPGPVSNGAGLVDVYRHNNDEMTGDAIDTYKELGSRKTKNVNGIPNGHGSGYGSIIYIPENFDTVGQTHKGFQIYSSTSHRAMYYRSSNENGDWQGWTRIDGSIMKPESIRELNSSSDDLNNIDETSIYKTGGNPKNLPIGSSEGILETIKGRQGKYQKWYGITGVGATKIFERFFANSRWYNWKEIKAPDLNGVLRTYNDTVTNVNLLTKVGIYLTNENTLKLPDILTTREDKVGLLKFYKIGNEHIYEYEPFEGKYKGNIFIAKRNKVTREQENLDWKKVSASEGHIKIHDSRNEQSLLPSKYAEHADWQDCGYVIHEWKWGNSIGLDAGKFGLTGNRHFIVTTYSPESKFFQTTPQGGNAAITSQIAYDIVDHRYFWRKSRDAQGTGWLDWEEVGGKGAKFDLNNYIQKPESQLPISDLNQMDGTAIRPFSIRCANVPNGYSEKSGIAFTYKDNANNLAQEIYFTSSNSNRERFYRVKRNGTWSSWKKTSHKVALPEWENSIQNPNELKYSGVFRTNNSGATGPYPDGLSSKDGFIKYYKYDTNETNYKGYQKFYSIAGTTAGKTYERHNENGQSNGWSVWREVGAGGGGGSFDRPTFNEWLKDELKKIFNAWRDKHKNP